MALTLRDSHSYETQIIDAVRGVNRALGGTYGTSSAIHKSEFNQYEVQLIDAIKGIGRTLSGNGLSLAGGGTSSKELQDLAKRVTKLESESFFRLVSGNVTLKEQYRNLWVPGWLAAGGVGSGGSGGVSYLRQLEDIYHNSTGILHGDGTPVDNGDVLVYDSTNTRCIAAAGGGGGSVTVTNYGDPDTGRIATVGSTDIYNDVAWGSAGQTTNTFELTVNGTTKTVCLEGYSGGGSGIDLAAMWSSLTNTTVDAYASTKIDIAHIPNITVSMISDLGSLYTLRTPISATAANGTLLGVDALSNAASSTAGSDSSRIEWDSDHNAWRVRGNLYADGWVAAGGVGSGGGGSSTLGGLSDVTLTSPTDGQVLKYSNGVWVNGSGGGGATSLSGLSDVNDSLSPAAKNVLWYDSTNSIWDAHALVYSDITDFPAVGTTTGYLKYTYSNGSGSWSIADAGGAQYLSQLNDVNVSETYQYDGYVLTYQHSNRTYILTEKSGGGISSVSLAQGSTNGTLKLVVDGVSGSDVAVQGLGSLAYKSSLTASDIPDLSGTYVTLATTQTITGAKTFTTNPVTIGSTSSLSVDQNSYIDIGPLRIKYDATNKALRITKASSSDNNNYGIYADGFVAAGGVGA